MEKNMKNELERFMKFLKGFGILGVIIVLGLYLSTGTYMIGPDEEGIVFTFGKYTTTTEPGIHWYFPSPIGKTISVKVKKIHRIEIGFRTINPGPPAKYRDVNEEALMLTGDENILEVDAIVQFKITDPKKYLFNLKEPEKAVKAGAEAALRQVVGYSDIETALTEGKGKIQSATKEKLQEILESYNSGIFIINVQLQDVQPPKAVSKAFKDVASAREDRDRYQKEALGYENDIIPKARGKANQMINEALAYKEKRVKEAEGEVERFLKIYEKYSKAKDLTKTRLYLESMEEIMGDVDKVIVDEDVKSGLFNVLGKEGGVK